MRVATLIAQLTDTHVVDPASDEHLFVDNNGRLAEAVARINAEQPAPHAVLITGDLANWGQPGEYAALKALLEPLVAPVLVIPGNHDDRDRTRTLFPELPWAEGDHASWVVTIGDVRLVGLDSTKRGHGGGEFDEERERWLRSVLSEPFDGPTVLAMHHPPFASGIDWMDAAGFDGLDQLAQVLSDHPVERILCGHLHRPMHSTIAGVSATVGLSTIQHVALDLEPAAVVSLINDPVGYHLHAFDGTGIVSHTRYIATGEEAYVPDWAHTMAVEPTTTDPADA